MMNRKMTLSIFTIMLLLICIPVKSYAETFGGLSGVVILDQDENEQNSEEGLQIVVTDYQMEKQSDSYWDLIIGFDVTNWELDTISLVENVQAILSYLDTYTFDAKLDFEGNTEIRILETIHGRMTFSIPKIVAASSSEDISVVMNALGQDLEI